MNRDNHKRSKPKAPERGVLALIRSIQASELKPSSLGMIERRNIVEHLTAEGFPVPEIADVLKVSERTVTRIRKRIRESNALNIDPHRTAQMAGMILQQAEVAAARFRRVASDSKVDASARTEAARSCWRTYRELIQTLQSLGYVGMAVAHPGARMPPQASEFNPEDLEAELTHIRNVARLSVSPPAEDPKAPPSPHPVD